MTGIPVISGKELCKILRRAGYITDHQTGSHIILRNKKYPYRRLSVPNHKELAKGTFRAVLRHAGLSLEEFIELMKK